MSFGSARGPSSPATRLDVELIPGVLGDVYLGAAQAGSPIVALFHASNGFRYDLTQLSWGIACRGIEVLNVGWIQPDRSALADRQASLVRLLDRGTSIEPEGLRPLLCVTWADSSLPVVTALLEGHGEDRPVIGAITIAGVFGDLGCSTDGETRAPMLRTAHASPYKSVQRPRAVEVVGIAPRWMLPDTLGFHRALRIAGSATRVIVTDSPAGELVAPRLPAGRAVLDLVETLLRRWPQGTDRERSEQR
jgi:hypothetical protein